MKLSAPILSCSISCIAIAQPYDFSSATALLNSELPNLNNHVAVIMRQNGREIYRFQSGDINYNTKTHLASFTKTISAGVVLSLVDSGHISLSDRIGDTLPFFNNSGIGDPTVTDCFGMRHGIHSPLPYEIDRRFTLAESVTRIGLYGAPAFVPGTNLEYDGSGMQSVGRLCEIRSGQSWFALASTRIFNLCNMPDADYLEFDPNPAIAGGARSSADETIRYAQMIIDGGTYNGQQVLSPSATQTFFLNTTRGLPVLASPWPPTHPLYPYGQQPDYGFGDWILAEYPATNPANNYVEEIVGAGAWGSFMWVDRRRALTAVFITDVPAGSQASISAALGLFAIARQQIDQNQVTNLAATPDISGTHLTWSAAPTATSYRIYASQAPIRSIYDLRASTLILQTSSLTATVPHYSYFAIIATFNTTENQALTPTENTLLQPTPCLADFNRDNSIDFFDYLDFVEAFSSSHPSADINNDITIDFFDYLDFVNAFSSPC